MTSICYINIDKDIHTTVNSSMKANKTNRWSRFFWQISRLSAKIALMSFVDPTEDN